MKIQFAPFMSIFLLAIHFPFGFSMPSTYPAFLWSPHQDGVSKDGIKKVVNYQTISQKDLAKSVLSQGGWSNLLCSEKNVRKPLDLALVFVGRELRSLDISGNKHEDRTLVDFLKVSFTSANFSMAFPYVAASEEEKIEKSLMSVFSETCRQKKEASNSNVAYLGSCALEGTNYKKLSDLHSVHDYLHSRKENRAKGHTDLVVVCHGSSDSLKELDQTHSENEIFSELISSVEQSGEKYTALYVSDPFKTFLYPYNLHLDRILAENTFGNGSVKSTTCDELCQIKSSLLEGLFVGLVLLIILVSGLCCMMGIDTPTRFETPQDS